MIRQHERCRICPGRLQTILDLGPVAVSAFPRPGEPDSLAAPLDLCCCVQCGLVQLRHSVDPAYLYQEYWYRSGINETMVAELRDVVECAIDWVGGLDDWDTVVDIGANDGTLLGMYPSAEICPLWTIAYEPATNLLPLVSRHATVVVPQPFPPGDHAYRVGAGVAKIVTSIACFYDLDDPIGFAREVARILAADGVWVIQLQDLQQMLDATAFDNVCLPTGARILTEHGLQAIDTVTPGTAVLTHRGRYRPVLKTYTRHYEGDLVELTAYGFGHTLQVTPDHPVYVQRAGQWQWIAAASVVLGDVVARPVLTDTTTDVPNVACYVGHGRDIPTLRMIPIADLVTLCGYYLAEGSIATNGDVLFYFGPDEVDLAEDCRARIIQLGFAARVFQRLTSRCVQAYGPLARVLQTLCGRGAGQKHLSPLLLTLNQALSEELLRAYMAGDGYTYRTHYLRASTISEQLALDISLLANRVGWQCSICEQTRPATCVIEGRVVSQLPLWDVLIHTAPKQRGKVWVEGGYQCGRVRQLRRVPYAGAVHNIEVAEDNTYVSPAMTVHNCHEHVTYLSLGMIQRIVSAVGLVVTYAERRAINGGSLRVFVQHAEVAYVRDKPTVYDLLDAEAGCDNWVTLQRFAHTVRERQRQIVGMVAHLRAKGQVIDLYGASTKANTLLQSCGLTRSVIRQAWERTPEKVGRETVGTRIPIVSEAEGRLAPPQALLVGAWQFREAFVRREDAYLQAGGVMILPLPEVEVVTWGS